MTLHPDERMTLVDALRPPPGFELLDAVATTFTLDLEALLAVPAAYALVGIDGARDGLEPIALLDAIRRTSDRITVLCQAGQVAIPPSRRLFGFLERSVVPVAPPPHGIVHPKLWVLRFASGDHVVTRVLLASRNLTFDRSWDCVLRLDEVDDGAVDAAPLADLLEATVGLAVVIDPPRHEAVHAVAEHLRSVRLDLPGSVTAGAILPIGPGLAPVQLPTHADRALVISPFLSDDFLQRINADRSTLVSRHSSLAGIASATLARFNEVWAFDDGSVAVDADDRATAQTDPGRPLDGLHAKVFVFERAGVADLYCGSANATSAAFATNLEVLAHLEGAASALGVDAVLGDRTEGFRRLLVPFHPPSDVEPDADVTDALDTLRMAIAAIPIRAQVEADATGDLWHVRYWTEQPLPRKTSDAVEVRVRPITLQPPGTVAPPGRRLTTAFSVAIESITPFLVLELTSGERTTGTVVRASLVGMPEERDRRLLQLILGNADRFYRYLLLLLAAGSDTIDLRALVDELDPAQSDKRRDDDHEVGGPSVPLLEAMLRSLRRSPDRLGLANGLVEDLAADGFLPPQFVELWSSVRTVAEGQPR